MTVPARSQCYCDVSDSVTYASMQRIDCSDLGLYEVPDDCFVNSANISELILSRNWLTSIRSTSLAELTELRSLYLDNNQLSFVDVTAFEFMTKLETLSLDHNLDLMLESATFSKLVSLQKLTTIGTNLVYLPDISACPALNWVDLRSSALESLPMQLFSPQLTASSMYVSLQGNEFPDASVISFMDLPDDTILHVDSE
ncbi:Leucine-rich repeat, partial [Trinorchestia longiramus]